MDDQAGNADTHVKNVADMLERGEGDDLLEEFELGVAGIRVWEVRDRGRTRPRDDRCKEDADQDGSTDTIHHQEDSKEAGQRCYEHVRGNNCELPTRRRKYQATLWGSGALCERSSCRVLP